MRKFMQAGAVATGLLMLVSLMASRQRRSKQSLLKWVVRWAGAEGRKRSLREKEPPLCL